MNAHGVRSVVVSARGLAVAATLVLLAAPIGVVVASSPAAAAGPAAASAAAPPTTTVLTGEAETATNVIIPLPGIDVRVYDATTGLLAGKKVTDASGKYRMTGLPAGTYRIRFSDPLGTYGLTWYPSASTQADATRVQVAVGVPVSASNLMYRTGQIGGAVQGPGGGLAGIDVRLIDANTGALVAKTVTGAGGSYTFPDLRQGAYGRAAYRIRFSDPTGTYATQWYNGAPMADTAQVLVIDVRAGTTPGPVNATLAPVGAIAGRLTDGTTGLSGIDVRVYTPTAVRVAKVRTDASGHYSVPGLAAGTYAVDFGEPTDAWLPTWFHSDPNLATATPVMVSGGATTTLADQVMAPSVHLDLTVNSALDLPDADPAMGVRRRGRGLHDAGRGGRGQRQPRRTRRPSPRASPEPDPGRRGRGRQRHRRPDSRAPW